MLYKFHVRVNVFCMELAFSFIFSLDVIRGSVGFIRKCNSTLPGTQKPRFFNGHLHVHCMCRKVPLYTIDMNSLVMKT